MLKLVRVCCVASADPVAILEGWHRECESAEA
jgi:hypothetical protein